MVVMLTLFPESADAAALDAYMGERLAPMLRAVPGVESVVVSSGPMMAPGGPAPYARAVIATLSGMEALIGFAQSPETEAVRREGEGLGVTVLMFEASG